MLTTRCPICDHASLETCFELSHIPVFTNFTAASQAEALQAPCGKMTLAQCQHCGFVFNADFQPELMQYQLGYNAERGYSKVYQDHKIHVVDLIHQVQPAQHGSAIEVGCGDGEFLTALNQVYSKKLSLLGVDPSVQARTIESIRFESCLFDESYLPRVPVDLVLFLSRHMIEHVANPLQMLRVFAQALLPDSVLYIETPRLDWILEHKAFFDFGYEHCSYFTDSFMERMLAAADLEIVAQEHTFKGQYFSICAKRRNHSACGNGSTKASLTIDFPEIAPAAQSELQLAKQGFANVQQSFLAAKQQCEVDSNLLSCCVWGCAQKGVIWLNLFDHQRSFNVVDINPHKQGRFVWGTGHEIFSLDQLKNHQPQKVLIMNPIYSAEIKDMVYQLFPDCTIQFQEV